MKVRRVLPLLCLLAFGAAIPGAAHAQAYKIPPGNPFAGVAGARAEVFVYGLRNPFRWSFDRQTGDMIVGDVGGSAKEEVTFLPRAQTAGANLGWNCREGSVAGPGACPPGSYVSPAYDYDNPGDAAVTGGNVVRDPALPAFQGRYLFGDFFTGVFGNAIQVTTLGPETATAPEATGAVVSSLVAFGEDTSGGLYAVSLDGQVYKLVQNGVALDEVLIDTFDQPIAVAAVPGQLTSLFVAEKRGVLKLRSSDGTGVHVFVDIAGRVSDVGERGLLAVAAAPDYVSSGRVFLFYTDNGGDLRIDEVRRSSTDATRADPLTLRNIITVEHSSASNHNGGQMLFGPDGYLYVSIGDGGSQGDPEGDAQSLGSLLGKVLRLDVREAAQLPPPTPPPAADKRKPKLLAVVAKRQRVLKLKGVVARLGCDERCRVSVSGRLRIGRRGYGLRKATRAGVAKGKRVRLRARLAKKGVQALRKALRDGKRPKVRLVLAGRDTAGNSSSLRRTVRVKR